MKQCTKCLVSKPLEEFAKCSRLPDGKQYWCRKCSTSAAMKSYKTKVKGENWPKYLAEKRKYWSDMKEKRPEKYKYSKLRSALYKYGITVEQYSAMLESQNNLCAICGETPDGKGNITVPFAVDHCHKTKKIRGLVHTTCNLILGLATDNPHILIRATRYLAMHV